MRIEPNESVSRLLIEHGAEFDLWTAATLGDLDRTNELLAEEANPVVRIITARNSGVPQEFGRSLLRLPHVQLDRFQRPKR